MHKVTVIGAGNVGATCAYQLAERIKSEYNLAVIFDPAQNPTTSTIWVAGVRLTARF